MINIVP